MDTKSKPPVPELPAECEVEWRREPQPWETLDIADGSCDLEGEAAAMDRLVAKIARMEYPAVPPDFVSSVMKGVHARRMPWWLRVLRWARSRHTVTVTPIRLIPAALVLVLALSGALASLVLQRNSHPQALLPVQGETGVPVTFEITMPGAKSVHLVGSFNGWSPQRCEMKQTGEGTWTALIQLPVGRYEYAFLVDGTTLVVDPGEELYQDDGFGNRNNLLVVGNHHETAI